MAHTAKSVAETARILLNDDAGIRWTDEEVLVWINEGRREMAGKSPKLFAQQAKVIKTLDAGTYQTVSTQNCYGIANVLHNINANGSVGKIIDSPDRDAMDNFMPGWKFATGKDVTHWWPDDLNPLAFWVYQAVAGGKIEMLLLITPADLGTIDDVALPFDQHLSTLVNYVLYRAYSKNAEVAQNGQIATSFLTLFNSAF